ncbi:MAG: hypothetical protein JRE40_08465 [Deltaproteobacteria bacterium]|nr:hypothetical protein [Deltaproteobacteria bacterium]MBW2675147.1 hypothetical protein [Deltaproteobacteria bacterium]
MATTEYILGRTEDGRVIVYFENAGPSSYSSGGFDVAINSLRAVEKIVSLGNNYGYRSEAEEASISGNTLTIKVRYYYYACPALCATGWEVTDGRDLSGVTFSGIVIGH